MLELTYTLENNHIIQLPDEIPTGAKLKIVVTEIPNHTQKTEQPSTSKAFIALKRLQQQLKEQPNIWQSINTEQYIQQLRNDWE